MFEKWYKKGYEAGYTARCVEDHSDQNRRLEDMLKYGKEIGHTKGMEEGYRIGYKCGYEEGEADTKARIGEIDLPVFDDIEEAMGEEAQDDE